MITIEGTKATAIVYQDAISEDAREQVMKICNHPMTRSAVIRIMPDCHAGKGCVIGFTALLSEKCIVPNIVGVDIGCGVMTTLFRAPNGIHYQELNDHIEKEIPNGLASRSSLSHYLLAHPEIRHSVSKVCQLIHTAEKEDAFLLSCGTLGGGNHFIEIDHAADDIYLLAVHTGSRSLGNSICGYYQKHGWLIDPYEKNRLLEMHRSAHSPEEHQAIQEQIDALLPVETDSAFVTGCLFDDYIECMLAAKDFAAANRACISQQILDFMERMDHIQITESFDTVHNYVDWYTDEKKQIIVRKGAISAQAGQKLCIPLNMRDGIIIGRGKGNPEWNLSAPHGAGRILSRKQARQTLDLKTYKQSMQGIHSWSVNSETIDEAPMVYKNPDDITRLISETVEIDYTAKTVYNFKAHTTWPGWKRSETE